MTALRGYSGAAAAEPGDREQGATTPRSVLSLATEVEAAAVTLQAVVPVAPSGVP